MLLTVSAHLKFEKDATRKPLGKGHFGTVYLVRDLQLNAPLAVKCLSKALLSGASGYFLEAARLYAARHPHVVQVLYACEDADMVYLAMPVYQNGSLKDVLETQRLTVREIVSLGIDMLSGLHHIHTRGLVHADVKPGNLLISASGQAAVSDFGLARHIDPVSGTASAGLFYEPHVPPERLASPAITLKFDVYQAGVTMYRMLYGEDYFGQRVTASGGDIQVHAANGTLFDFPAEPHIPEPLRRALKRAMSPNPDDRQSSCLALANDVAKIDKLLDWRLSSAPGMMKWSNEQDDRRVEVELVSDAGGLCSVTSTKKHGSGRQRIRAHCSSSLVRARALQAVRAALAALDVA